MVVDRCRVELEALGNGCPGAFNLDNKEGNRAGQGRNAKRQIWKHRTLARVGVAVNESRIVGLRYRKSELEILYERTKKPALDGDIPKRAIRRRFCDGIDP